MKFHTYHHLSANQVAGRTIFPFPAPKDWPAEWKTIYYKSYDHVTKVQLPPPTPPAVPLSGLVEKRESVRGKHAIGVSLDDFSTILKYSCGLQDTPRFGVQLRAQPSGGARFPLETYVVSLKEKNGLVPGVYHYDVVRHAMDTLLLKAFEPKDISELFTYPWARDCSAAVIITAVFERGSMKYGERAYRYALIEAGHIGQGIYLSGAAREVGATGMGGTRDELLHQLLEIDGTQESLVYALMLSK